MKKRFSFIPLLGFLLLFSMPATVSAATANEVAVQLVCQCGCTSILTNCTHQDCMVRDAMLTAIGTKVDQGQSSEQIVAFFVDQYGEQVLASPPKTGFNLTAWILPFAAIIVGAGVIFFALRKWVKREAFTPDITDPLTTEANTRYYEQIQKELSNFNEGGFR